MIYHMVVATFSTIYMDPICPSDFSDEEWALVAHPFECKDPRGQKPTQS